jgi:hypothetical protein
VGQVPSERSASAGAGRHLQELETRRLLRRHEEEEGDGEPCGGGVETRALGGALGVTRPVRTTLDFPGPRHYCDCHATRIMVVVRRSEERSSPASFATWEEVRARTHVPSRP